MKKLTIEMFVAGTVDPEAVTLSDLAAFSEQEKLGVVVKKGMSKADALNALAEAIEQQVAGSGEQGDEADPVKPVVAGPETAAAAVKTGYLGRRAGRIAAQMAQSDPLGGMEEQAKKSAYLKRRLRK